MQTDTRVSEREAAGLRWRVHDHAPPTTSTSPFVLLHGGGVDSALLSYGEVLPRLGSERRVIAPDLPGYGGTPAPTGAPCTIEWYTAAVYGLTEALDLVRFDLGGLSLGGGIALAYALAHPDRVRRLVLLEPYGLTDRIPYRRIAMFLLRHPRVSDWLTRQSLASPARTRRTLRSLVRNKERLTDELVAAVMAEAAAAGAGVAFSAFRRGEIGPSGLRTCLLDRLPELAIPTLVVAGAESSLVPSADCRRAVELLPNGRLEVLERCGHWIARDQPDRLVALVDSFLSEPLASNR